jgi:hypothetical protein
MITKTVGAGGDYSDWYTAISALAALGSVADNYTLTQISDCTVSGALSSKTVTFTGTYSLTITSNKDHLGDPTAGWKTYLPCNYSMYFRNAEPVPNWHLWSGVLVIEKLNVVVTGTGTGGDRIHVNFGSNTVRNCIVKGINHYDAILDNKERGIANQGVSSSSFIFYNNKIYNCDVGVYCRTGGVVTGYPSYDPAGTKVVENCTIYGGLWGLLHDYDDGYGGVLEGWTFKNIVCSGQAVTGGESPLAFNIAGDGTYNSMSHCADDDGSQPAYATSKQTPITPANEFKSTTSTDTTFLFLKNNAVGVLAANGIAPTYAITDIAGYAIPQAGNYPIGCHVSIFTSDIHLPTATGSGADYNVENNSGSAKVVDVVDGIGTIDDALTRTLQAYESVTVVDYATNKWAVI